MTQLLLPTLFEPEEINGDHATFELAKNDPIHSWFPYLEGYAASFVESLRRRFMPEATQIIDPFAGTGTTPLALASIGVQCGYCEVNPAMRFVIQTKLKAVGAPPSRRAIVAAQLLDVAETLPREIAKAIPDDLLRADYYACFAKSEFFQPHTWETVLCLRTFCDAVSKKDDLLGDLVTLAVIANLVPCSLLKRQGDVRYKTKAELSKGIPDLTIALADQLRKMGRHLKAIPSLEAHAVLLASDAKALEGAPLFNAQGVITSPPYLNGTNYIRNTKLELWFLREIRSGADLRTLRDDVVTSGINDVTTSTAAASVLPAVERVVRQIEAAAYDQRIHRMVAGYFGDMHRVLCGLWAQTSPGATICIDIGDSRYAGVNVPTHDLLTDVARDIGFTFKERIPLRTRLSKDGSQLSQDVLVFRRGEAKDRCHRKASGDLRERWKWFRDNVPHQQHPFTKRNWGHPLHSACSYQGKMKPSLAHFLVHCFSEPGQAVLDPFSGAGTIPFEAALQGRRAYGFDISIMAAAITNAKINPPDHSALQRLLAKLDAFIKDYKPTSEEVEQAAAVRFNRPIPEYFHAETMQEILAARKFFANVRNHSPEWCFALTSMLHILHGNRPYALSRRSHPVTPFAPTGPAEYRPVMGRLRDKIERGLDTPLPPEFVRGHCLLTDIRATWPQECKIVDSIITSPPFFDSTRFYMTNWMRYWFCGWERSDFDIQAGQFMESLQRQSLDVYRVVFERFREHLAPKGVAVLHLGQSKKCNMAVELGKMAQDYLEVAEVFSEDVTHCEKHGVRDKGTVTSHQYLVLRPK